MRIKNLVWSLAALAVVGLVGCSGGESGSGTTGSSTTGGKTAENKDGAKKDFRIVMIAKSQSNPVFTSAKTGAEAAAKKLGEENNLNIVIDWQTPNDEDPQLQAQKVEAAANEGADAILVSCSDAAKLTNAINTASDKGVPVMTFDSDAPDSKRFAFYGADDEAAGAQVMDELGAVMNGKGNYAIIAGTATAPNLQKRVKGCMDEAKKKYPDMKWVGTFYHKETPQDAAAEVTRAMNANPQIDCWAMIGGWPLFTTALMNLDPNKVKIVSVDALPEELGYVDKGIAAVLLAQPTYDWGYKSVEIIVNKVVKKQDVPAFNKMELIKVDKASLGTWAKQLQDWGFTVDAKYLK